MHSGSKRDDLIAPVASVMPRVRTRLVSHRLSIDPDTFATNFDKRPFYLEHDLQSHPLFELSAMAALSERLYPSLVEWNCGHAGAQGKPDQIKPATLSCKETILAVGMRPAWVLLREIQRDAIYKALIDELLDETKARREDPTRAATTSQLAATAGLRAPPLLHRLARATSSPGPTTSTSCTSVAGSVRTRGRGARQSPGHGRQARAASAREGSTSASSGVRLPR